MMYSFIKDIRELSYSQSFPPIGFIPKTFRSKIDFFRYNQLPPIKEEEGNISRSDIELRNVPLNPRSSNDTSYEKRFETYKTNSNGENGRKKFAGEGWSNTEVSPPNLPPLVNVNCLMNVNMKQEQSIWNTSFGKRLINGKAIVPEISLPVMKKPKKDDEKLRDSQRSKSTKSSRCFFRGRNIQLGVGDKTAKTKKKKTKSEPGQKTFRKIEEQNRTEEEKPQFDAENETWKPEPDCMKTSKTGQPSSESLTNSLTSRKSKNHNFLSNYVQNILGGITVRHTCEYCHEIFSKLEELDAHKNKHEKEKETCILCKKVFYDPKEFTQHLLTHESVDKFSCKKCKKYFPSLKKYRAHCKRVHSASLESAEPENLCSLEQIKEQTVKYECKRCQLELDSEEDWKVHRRNHIRLDLMGAYLLSNKRV